MSSDEDEDNEMNDVTFDTLFYGDDDNDLQDVQINKKNMILLCGKI